MAKRKSSTKKLSKTSSLAATPFTNKVAHSSWLSWFDEHILFILSGFLFAFIPLYPKLPLADLIPGYIVRLRLEDLFVGSSMLIFAIQVFRKKAQWKTPFTWLMVSYAIVGLLSTLSAIFITKTVPAQPLHVAKTLLHYFRYLEYFSVFFISYSAVKHPKDLVKLFGIFALTVSLITIYGYGQRYLYWPVYSTMNREFSKGIQLYLTQNARVQSTFGGHYDMAAYLVIALPMLLSVFFSMKKWRWKIPLFLSYILGLWLLIMSASRTSFVAFVAGVLVVLLLFTLIKSGWKQKVWWGFSRGFLTMSTLILMFFTFGESITERFSQVIAAYPDVQKQVEDIEDTRKKLIAGEVNQVLEKYQIATRLPEAKPPENGQSVNPTQGSSDTTENVLTPTDEQPTTKKPLDVDYAPPEVVTVTTVDATGTATVSTVIRDRTFSDNALKYGLSMAIRLDTLWPQAIRGFQRNPLVGSGYATLTKKNVEDFTEAESTDNNFLRTLGETGLLGFISFYGLILIGMFISVRVLLSQLTIFPKAIAIGFIAGSIGLLFNAIYIDVYASSKVAFTYWLLSGFVLAYFVHELNMHSFSPKFPNKQIKQAVLPKSNQ